MTSNAGVIGLGAMGGGMARSLRRHGCQVQIFPGISLPGKP